MINIEKYNPLTEQIINAALEVHSVLGCGFLESVYQKAIEHEFHLRKIPFASQTAIQVHYKEIIAGNFVPDLIVFEKIVVELKAQENINYEQIQMQIINYLVAAKLDIGLMLNFGKTSLEMKRYIIPLRHSQRI